MDRRQQLENIIIGTLLESTERRNYYEDCRCISQDMFRDATNRRIFGLIAEMNGNGKVDTTPADIFAEYGEAVVDIAADMCDLFTDWSFIHLKTEYNEKRFFASCVFGIEQIKTDVGFEDYVKQFIKIVCDEERNADNRPEVVAA